MIYLWATILINELFYDISINLSINLKIIELLDPASVNLNFERISIWISNNPSCEINLRTNLNRAHRRKNATETIRLCQNILCILLAWIICLQTLIIYFCSFFSKSISILLIVENKAGSKINWRLQRPTHHIRMKCS